MMQAVRPQTERIPTGVDRLGLHFAGRPFFLRAVSLWGRALCNRWKAKEFWTWRVSPLPVFALSDALADWLVRLVELRVRLSRLRASLA